MAHSLRTIASTALIGLVLTSAPVGAQQTDGRDAPPGASAAEQRRRDAETREDEAQQRAAEARRRSAEAKRKADVAQRNAEQLRRDEADMLARARAEAEERAAERRAREAEADRLEAERAAIAARNARDALDRNQTSADRGAAEERLIEAAKAADTARREMEAEREAEVSRLADKLRQAQERRAARLGQPPPDAPAPAGEGRPEPALPPPAAEAPAPSWPAAVAEPAPVVPPPPALAAPLTETRVSVLIVMQPGDRGIRRVNKSADPVICLGDACWVSRGPGEDARRMRRREALGALNTLGSRAGACRDSLACVFRNVDLGAARALVQPVDLRLVNHDKRQPSEIGADTSCEVIGGRLSCIAPIAGAGYRLWIVPESVAERAGPRLLDRAVRDGLEDGRRAGLSGR